MNINYRNKEWLQYQYQNNKLSQEKIANICGVIRWTIRKWLNKFDIKQRSSGEGIHLARGNHCYLSLEAIEWINGEMLGDGHLEKHRYSAFFSYGSKYLEYIKYVSDTLKSFGVKQSGNIIKRTDKKLGNTSYRYNSLSYEELLTVANKWYPERKKIVPKDLNLSPSTCRQWYIGDGCLRKQKSIVLHTNGFKVSDVEWLVKQLSKLGFKVNRWESNNSIYIPAYLVKDFLHYIGECPVSCYQYKFNYKIKD